MRRPLTDIEALMWNLDSHPMLVSTMGSIALLGATPDPERLRTTVGHAIVEMPALRRRVSSGALPLAEPMWEPDPDFDLDHHLRQLRLPARAGLDTLFDTATQLINDPFDRSRPPWQITLLTGLPRGRSALVVKAHHSIADGQGLLQLGQSMFDLSADAPARPPVDVTSAFSESGSAEPQFDDDSPHDSATAAVRKTVDRVLGLAADAVGLAASPTKLSALAGDLGAATRMLGGGVVDQPSVSPLWTDRSRNRRALFLTASLPDLRDAASRNGHQINSVFVAACAEAAIEYHRANDSMLGHVSASVAISTRTDDHPDAHNAVVPCGIVIPGAGASQQDRLDAIAEQITERRSQLRENDQGIGTASHLATFVPSPLAAHATLEQARKLDFATSNLPGPPVPLWFAGAPIETMFPLGPVAGTAFNITMLSFVDEAAFGLHFDPLAVTDAALLASELRSALARLRVPCRIRSPRFT